MDSSGLWSPTGSVRLIYVQMAALTLVTNGNGSVSLNCKGQPLQVGKTYTVTADPAEAASFRTGPAASAPKIPS